MSKYDNDGDSDDYVDDDSLPFGYLPTFDEIVDKKEKKQKEAIKGLEVEEDPELHESIEESKVIRENPIIFDIPLRTREDPVDSDIQEPVGPSITVRETSNLIPLREMGETTGERAVSAPPKSAGLSDGVVKQFSQFDQVLGKPTFDLENLKSFTINQIRGTHSNVEFLRTQGFSPLATFPASKSLRKVSDTSIESDKLNFQTGDNISIRLGQEKSRTIKVGIESEFSIIDLDLEVEEARTFAHHFLRSIETATFGRRSAVKSHYLFRVKSKAINSKTNQFPWPPGMRSRNKFDDSAIILELKPSGHCLVPPSTHPSGENLFWMSDNTNCAYMEYHDIYSIAGKIAAGTVLMRSWADGIRDNLVISMAGWLLKEGWPYKEVAEFFNALFLCVWPIDQADVRRWRIRIQVLATEINKAKEQGNLFEDGDTDKYDITMDRNDPKSVSQLRQNSDPKAAI